MRKNRASGKDVKYAVNKIIKIAALLSLAGAYLTGYFLQEKEWYGFIKNHFPEKEILQIGSDPYVYEMRHPGKSEREALVVIGSSNGWGGPLKTGTVINPKGTIEKVVVISHKETPLFLKVLINHSFFDQFSKMELAAPFQIGKDVDAVSGATISSKAFTKAVRNGAHWAGRHEYNVNIKKIPQEWNFGANEFILIVLYAIVIISAVKGYVWVRRLTLIFGMVFIGFYLNYPLSISNFSSLLLGYFPSLYEQAFWWLLGMGALLLTVLYGRNLYCSWMCPFGGMQEMITLIGGVKLRLSQKTIRIADYSVYFFFWLAFMITFITGKPSMGTFEPFATLFGFKGIGVQWYLVSVAVVGSFLIPRFWCRFFCPVGAFLKQTLQLKKNCIQKMRLHQASNDVSAHSFGSQSEKLPLGNKNLNVSDIIGRLLIATAAVLILIYFYESITG